MLGIKNSFHFVSHILRHIQLFDFGNQFENVMSVGHKKWVGKNVTVPVWNEIPISSMLIVIMYIIRSWNIRI